MQDSAPPAIITSARRIRHASGFAHAWVPVVQAVTIATLGPAGRTDGQVAEICLMMVAGMKKGEILRRTILQISAVRIFDHRRPPMPEPMLTPIALAVGVGHFQAAVLEGVDGGGQSVVDEGIHAAGILGREVLAQIEIPHLTGNLNRKGGCVKTADAGDPGAAFHEIAPGFIHAVAYRRNDTETGDHDSAPRHL